MRLWGWLAIVILGVALMIAGCSKDRLSGNSPGAAYANANGNANGKAPVAASNTPQDNVRRVTISELREMLEQNKAVVIDVRGDVSYQQEHIKGALDIPENQVVTRASDLPKDKLIVLYCSWPSEHTSARAAQSLQKAGYENVAALLGGTNAWKTAGFPMESGQ